MHDLSVVVAWSPQQRLAVRAEGAAVARRAVRLAAGQRRVLEQPLPNGVGLRGAHDLRPLLVKVQVGDLARRRPLVKGRAVDGLSLLRALVGGPAPFARGPPVILALPRALSREAEFSFIEFSSS